jgi:RNA polymerase sigma-70 factor, ECF subfamily
MQTTGWPVPDFARRGGADGTVTDDVLVAAIAAGDRDAMRALYNRHRIRVFRFAARLVDDASAAEDVASEAFIEVWRQAARFEGRSSVSTWIMSIVRFKALSARRRRPETGLDMKVAETIPDPCLSPEQIVLETDRRAQLRACLV